MKNVKQFFRKLKRVWQFLPHIWRGYDFDYGYSIDLFKYQLERTANYLESNRAYGMGATNRASRIRTAIKLLNKVYDEDYGCEYRTKMVELYGTSILDFWFEDTGNDSSYLRQAWEFRDDVYDVKKVFDNLFKESQEKQNRAEKLVWEFISHNIKDWQD